MRFVSHVVLPLVLWVYIAVETYAKLHHTSICGSTGCKLAGELLVFPSIYLNFMGLAAVAGILALGWLSLKRQVFEKLFFIALYSSIGFESIMFAYQFFVNPEPCVFCGGVYGGLLIVALFARPRYLLYASAGIVALWVALGALAIPQNMELVSRDGAYLIHSETCPHCRKVKSYFAKHNIAYTPIDVHSPNARLLLKSFGISSIPDLIIKHGSSIQLINGDEAIIEHYQKQLTDPDTTSTSQATETESSPAEIPSLTKSDGCGLDAQLDALPSDDGGCGQESDIPLK